jgi:ABC-type phosphate transport system substrate-binding protein
MRKLSRMLAGAAAVAAAAALVAGSVTAASADPIGKNGKAVLPAAYDVVGVGSNTTQFVLDQISLDYNKTVPANKHSAAHPYLYSFDAVGSAKIVTKAGCGGAKTIVRPNGSGAGLKALTANTADGKGRFCIDFGRSSSGRAPTAPAPGPNGVAYVAFARDAVTYATRTAKFGGTDAPANLTKADLTKIYTCAAAARNWKAFGGKNATIVPFLPQSSSGTRSFFLKTIGVTNPGSCVSDGPGATGSIEENEGTNKLLNNAAAIVPFSVGAYVEQAFHSGKGLNKFGANQVGVLGLDRINGIIPLTGKVINHAFAVSPFGRTLYNIVRTVSKTKIIPGLVKIFGSKAQKGYLCTSPVAAKDITNYGFLNWPTCGSLS